ncbi:hypothetical protein BKN37_22590 [Mycobacterium talmoniae]|nr:hypothetical protein BKN37_22590 [Mycobacterium talmoniae]TDH47210.1 DUF732 domain-containing protein [Mycobacterium eburneum]
MDTLRTGIVVGVAALGLAVGELFTGAGAAHADDYEYLGGLRAAGVWIHKDAEPYVVRDGHRMCGELRRGVPPEDVAAEFPQLDPAVFLSILRDHLCPDAPG